MAKKLNPGCGEITYPNDIKLSYSPNGFTVWKFDGIDWRWIIDASDIGVTSAFCVGKYTTKRLRPKPCHPENLYTHAVRKD
jgi:hypothetical protein